ncbi:glycosyltransferase [Alloprevotella sp. OH1205_COT-284]|uniref:glycosyltransferase family 2 protein n=1 Tax=Alloprevotella sp. OH1205_COT-284 TaxID=2491043 RepID=UPI000F5E2F2D|nr:glycosyltransferase family 2 protein [Alloprevotella sp. OH1205_COT-284]RRD80597.1 glycosyltransferase [Alloprevotella sp. OH1205_COT-284]
MQKNIAFIKITIVTVCYNAVKEIETTMLSVLNQTYPNVEYIIVDGGSTDGTMEVINKYRDRLSAVISEQDKGTYDAMNKGIAMATGDWINFMNAGDSFCTIDVLYQMFSDKISADCGVLFGNSREYRDNILYSVKPRPFYLSKKKHFSKGICHQSMFLRTMLARRYPFDLAYPVAADFNMVYHIFKNELYRFEYKDVDVAQYDLMGFSNKNVAQAYYEEACIINPNAKNNRPLLMLKGKTIHCIKQAIIKMLGLFPSLKRKLRGINKIEL